VGAAASAAATMLWSRISMGERIALIGAAILLVIGDWIVGALLEGPGSWVSTLIAWGAFATWRAQTES
jgi:hypothetical protein